MIAKHLIQCLWQVLLVFFGYHFEYALVFRSNRIPEYLWLFELVRPAQSLFLKTALTSRKNTRRVWNYGFLQEFFVVFEQLYVRRRRNSNLLPEMVRPVLRDTFSDEWCVLFYCDLFRNSNLGGWKRILILEGATKTLQKTASLFLAFRAQFLFLND